MAFLLSCFSQKHPSITSRIKASYEVIKDLPKTLIYHKAHSIRIDVKHSAAKTVFYQAEYLICVPCRLPKQLEHRHTLRECRKTRIASTAHVRTHGRNSPYFPTVRMMKFP